MTGKVSLPFTMRASITRGDPPPRPIPDPLPPGWVRIPIAIPISISHAMAYHLWHGGPPPAEGEEPHISIAGPVHLDLDRAHHGDLDPQEVHAMLDVLQGAEHGLGYEFADISDRLPAGPPSTPSATHAARPSRPGSGLAALHAVQRGAAPMGAAGHAAPHAGKPHPAKPGVILTDSNVRELADLIWTEARGIGDQAMTAVGWTIRNRMGRNGVTEVDKAWHGYSHGTKPTGANLKHAETIARGVLNGTVADPTNGATHFYSPNTMPKDGVDVEEMRRKKSTSATDWKASRTSWTMMATRYKTIDHFGPKRSRLKLSRVYPMRRSSSTAS